MKKKNVLFVCMHNVFRSQVAEQFFKKFYRGKKYSVDSAGIFPYLTKDLIGDKGYEAEKKIVKKHSIRLGKKPRAISSEILKKTDILVIVANDIPKSMIRNEKAFKGKIVVWKVADVKEKDRNKKKVAEKAIVEIKKRVEKFAEELK